MFACFGVTRSVARQVAQKKLRVKHDATLAEFTALLDEKTQALMESMREIKLSPTFSNRAEAIQYKALAEKDGGQRLTVRCREKGGINERTGKAKLIWKVV